MDFSTNDVIEQKLITKSPIKKDTFSKRHSTVTVQLLLVLQNDGSHYPLGFRGLNSFQIKEMLELGALYPCNTEFPAHSKILFADKVRDSVSTFDFSPSVLEQYSLTQLQKTSWLQNGVITLVTDQNPENVMAAYELVQTLDKQVLCKASNVTIKLLCFTELSLAGCY